MNFSEALKAMKMGSKVSRELWRGKVSHWAFIEGQLREYSPDGNWEYILSVKQKDILADDWWIVT